MTAEQNTQLAALFDAYTASKQLYDAQKVLNDQWLATNPVNTGIGGFCGFSPAIQANHCTSLANWNAAKAQSASSLLVKKAKMEEDLLAYNNLKADIERLDSIALQTAQVIAEHPEVATAVASAQVQAATQGEIAKGNAVATDNRKKILLITGICLGVTAIIGTVIYFVTRPKKD